jgi:hypothetical protein
LALVLELDDTWRMASILGNLGNVAQYQGEDEQAVRWYQESLRLSGGVQRQQRDAIGAPILLVDRARYEHNLTAAQVMLGEEVFAAQWAEGWAMPLKQTIQHALEDPSCVIDEERGYNEK